MGRKLAVIAILGIGVSVVCMGAAAAIGGSMLGSMDFLPFGDGPRCKMIAGATATSRTLAWDGSDHVDFALQGHARYRPGTDDSVHVTGDPQVLAHLKIKDGTIQLDCKGWGWGWGERPNTKDVEVTLPGRIFKRFEIAGAGKLTLDALDQQDLRVEMAGIATIEANGRVENLDIEMAGVGHADFAKVTGSRARVELAGVGKADIAPIDEARIEIAGPGEVRLHTNPKKLDSEIAGPGRIRNLAD